MGSDGINLVDDIFDADDRAVGLLGQSLLNKGVVCEGDALLVHLAVPALVHQLTHRLEVGVAEHDVRLDFAKHVDGRLVHTQEDTVVDLPEAHELENLTRLGVQVVKASEAHNKHKLGFGLDVETTLGARVALQAHEISFLLVWKEGWVGSADGR